MSRLEEYIYLVERGHREIPVNHMSERLADYERFIEEYEAKKNRIQLDSLSFEAFWDMYDKKIDRPVCQKKWLKLSQKDKADIMMYLPRYKQAEPNKKYRKGPEAFLNRRSWENEIIAPVTQSQPDKLQQTIDVISNLRNG